jgi:hypothetical protein
LASHGFRATKAEYEGYYTKLLGEQPRLFDQDLPDRAAALLAIWLFSRLAFTKS